MTKYLFFILLISLNANAKAFVKQETPPPFTSQVSKQIGTIENRFSEFSGVIDNNKVLLNWKVEHNAAVSMFEVEKSIDGKKFTLAAIVFGTDNTSSDEYQFMEKASKQKYFYRIKLIDKQQQVIISTPIDIKQK